MIPILAIILALNTAAVQYDVSPGYMQCLVYHESRYEIEAVGDNGASVGPGQFKRATMELALKMMGVEWDWEAQGDPRKDPEMMAQAMAFLISEGYARWWSTAPLCEDR